MTEKCTSCGIDTGVPIDMHIDYRYYYVEGAGQLCKLCWDTIYKVVDEDASIAQSVEQLTLNQQVLGSSPSGGIARVAQLVERHLAKVNVVGSSPISRSDVNVAMS